MSKSFNAYLLPAAFIIAFLGVLLGSVDSMGILMWVALGLGIVLGFYNVSGKESIKFMLSFLVLASVSGVMAFVPTFGELVTTFFTHLLAVFGPAALIVALRGLMKTGKN